MTDVKFSASNGQWAISYEEDDEFLKNELRPILEDLLASSIWDLSKVQAVIPQQQSISSDGDRAKDAQAPQMTMNTLCAKIGCETGTDLVLAACVYLTYIGQKDTLPRREILQTMRSATRYFKESYSGNLTTALQSLVKQGKLMERSSEVYILTPSYASELEASLA